MIQLRIDAIARHFMVLVKLIITSSLYCYFVNLEFMRHILTKFESNYAFKDSLLYNTNKYSKHNEHCLTFLLFHNKHVY